MKILFISPKIPFQESEARARVINNYIKQLVYEYNHQVDVIYIGDLELEKEVPDYVNEFIAYKLPNKLSQLVNVLVGSVFRNDRPIQNSLFWSKYIYSSIKTHIETSSFDLVINELIRTSNYKFDVPQIIDLADLFSNRYKSHLNHIEDSSSVYGQFTLFSNKLLQKILETKFIQKIILKKELSLIEKEEKKVVEVFDRTTLVSTSEVKLLSEELSSFKKRIYWLPNGTDTFPFEKIKNHKGQGLNIAFMGVMNTTHNEEAIVNFIKKIYPIILEALPNTRLNIIGKNPTAKLKSLSKSFKNIRITGFVSSIEDEILKNDIFINPVVSFSGIQTKLFEAARVGLPIVTTESCLHGLKYDKEQTPFLLGIDNQDFAQKCVDLLKSDALRTEMGRRAYKFVKENYFWDTVGKKLQEIISFDEM